MSAFFLYHSKTRPTGRALARLIGIPSGRTYHHENAKISHLIRWGNPQEIVARGGYSVLNSTEAINRAGNKFKSLDLMRRGGVNVPNFTQDDSPEVRPEVWFGRSFKHSRGTDIVIFDGKRANRGCDYYVQYIEPLKEYRVHVVGGEVLFAQKKYYREQLFARLIAECGSPLIAGDLENTKNYIRNNDHGWGFHDMEDLANVPKDVLAQAVLAVESLGLDFGAVDIITSKAKIDGRHQPYVLEVNTAPGLRERNLVKYATKFKALIA